MAAPGPARRPTDMGKRTQNRPPLPSKTKTARIRMPNPWTDGWATVVTLSRTPHHHDTAAAAEGAGDFRCAWWDGVCTCFATAHGAGTCAPANADAGANANSDAKPEDGGEEGGEEGKG